MIGIEASNFSDPFGLCKKGKNGTEDPECRAIIEMLTRLSGAKGISKQAKEELEGAISFYERLEVDLVFHYLPQRAECCDNSDETRRFQGGGSRGHFIWINSAMSPADMALAAWHEAQHAMYGRQAAGQDLITYQIQAQIYLGLPSQLQAEAIQTGRLLRHWGYLP
jgi:hypothetical protein